MVLLTHCWICQFWEQIFFMAIHFQSYFFSNVGFGLAPAAEAEAGIRNGWIQHQIISNSSHLKRWNKSMNHFQGDLLLVFQTLACHISSHFIWTMFPNCLEGWVPPGKRYLKKLGRSTSESLRSQALGDSRCLVREFSPIRGGNQWGFPE